MPTYQIFTEDVRYAIPTFQLVTGYDYDGVQRFAAQELADDASHCGVEVYLKSLWLFGIGSLKSGGLVDVAVQ